MKDLESLRSFLSRAPQSVFPSLILESDYPNVDGAQPVLCLLLKVGTQGFMIAVPAEGEIMEAVDSHLQVQRSDPDTVLGEFTGIFLSIKPSEASMRLLSVELQTMEEAF